MATEGLELAIRASTTFTHPTRAEHQLAAKIGLPRGDAWTGCFAAPDGVGFADRDLIRESGGFRKSWHWKRVGESSRAIVEPIDDHRRAILAAAALRRRGGGQDALSILSSAGAPAWFAAAARDARCADSAAVLVVHRSVEVEAIEEGDDADLCVDYDLEIMVAASAGARAFIADAAVHAALGRQFDADMTALGKSLAAAGHQGEVLCNVICRADTMRDSSIRIADLLRYRQDVFLDFVDFDVTGFPDFREPSVLDF